MFVTFGAYFGAVAVSVADIEKSLDVSHGVFGALLGLALFCGGCSSAIMSVRAHRNGVGRTMREALIVWAAVLVVAVFVPVNVVLMIALVVAIGAAGAVDVVMNTLATQAVHASPTKLLRVHATYNFGAAIGAGVAGVVVANGLDWRLVWIGVGASAACLAFLNWPQFNQQSGGGAEDDVPLHAAIHSLVTERILLVAAAFVLGAVVEGGIDAWGPLYLRADLESGVTAGALATAAGYVIGCMGRLGMSALSERWGAKWCSVLGTSVCAFGLILLVTSPSMPIALVGLALAVGGITTNWPLLISYATENSPNSALITGGMSTAGYAGLVVSPAILGVVGNVSGLRASLVTVTVCALIVVVVLLTLPRHRRASARNAS